MRGCKHLPLFNSGQNHTKCVHDVAISSRMNFWNLNCDIPCRLLECQWDESRWVDRFRPFLTLKLVAMATSCERSEKDGQIINLQSNVYQWWKLGEHRSGGSWDNLSEVYFKERKKRRGAHVFGNIELRSYWTQFTKLTPCNTLRNAKATNKGEQYGFANFYPKIGCHEPSEKRGQFGNLLSNNYRMVKIWWKSVR